MVAAKLACKTLSTVSPKLICLPHEVRNCEIPLQENTNDDESHHESPYEQNAGMKFAEEVLHS